MSAVAATVQAPWWEKFSTWSRLVRVLCCILKWRYQKESSADRLVRAKAVLCRIVQRDVFGDECAALSAQKSVDRSSKIAKFVPYLDDQDVMRVGGRLQDTCLPEETKHPILLGSHHLTTLLLQFLHVSQMHQGVEHVSMTCVVGQDYAEESRAIIDELIVNGVQRDMSLYIILQLFCLFSCKPVPKT